MASSSVARCMAPKLDGRQIDPCYRLAMKIGQWMLALVLPIAACSSSSDATIPAETTTASTAEVTTTTAPVETTTTLPPEDTTTTVTVAPGEAADVVYLGGDVVTMDDSLGTAEALAVKGDLIAAVGTRSDIESLIGDDTTVIDLDRRALAPGFVDPHTHILSDFGDFSQGQAMALGVGITSLGDGSVEPDLFDSLVTVAESEELRIRTSMYLTRTDTCGVDMGDWYTAYPAGSTPASRLRVAGVKIFDDGGTCGPPALSETFADGFEPGTAFNSVGSLTEWIGAADAADYQVVVHAIGDLAIRDVQDAYAQVLGTNGNPLRHRIDHNAIPAPDLVARYGELGLIPLVFALSGSCEPDTPWTDFYRANGDRPADIVNANPNVPVAWHGDDPWVPPISPILDVYSLVTRDEFAEDGSICEAPEWAASGGVSIEQAYAMTTINAAFALGVDDTVGSLAPGKKADLLVLSANPLAVPISEVPGIAVLSTMIGGATEFCADDAEMWCSGS